MRTWTFHNIVAHPLMQVLRLVGCNKAGRWVHDATIPKDIDEARD